tara:strand:- start:607 stop:861 length:255 start_codon:yes stop_codon:yes gene_type:complete
MKLFFLFFHICSAYIRPGFWTRRTLLYATSTYQITTLNTEVINNKTTIVNEHYVPDYMKKLIELEKKREDAEIRIHNMRIKNVN